MLTYRCGSLAGVSSVSLAAELDLLLHLIALPSGTTYNPSLKTLQRQQPRFPTGAVAALYAAQVLSLSGGHPCFLQYACPATKWEQSLNIVLLMWT